MTKNENTVVVKPSKKRPSIKQLQRSRGALEKKIAVLTTRINKELAKLSPSETDNT